MTVCATSFVNLCMYEEGSLISEDLQSGLNLRILPAVTLNKRKLLAEIQNMSKHVHSSSPPFWEQVQEWVCEPFALLTNHGLF